MYYIDPEKKTMIENKMCMCLRGNLVECPSGLACTR